MFTIWHQVDAAPPELYQCPRSKDVVIADEYRANWLARMLVRTKRCGVAVVRRVTGEEVARWAWRSPPGEALQEFGLSL